MSNEMFYITMKDERINHLKLKDARLSRVIDKIGEIECYCHNNGYEFIIGEIVGQMLSNKVADKLVDRLTELCQGSISQRRISQLNLSDLRSTGVSYAKAQYILNFNEAIKSGKVVLDELQEMPDTEVMNKLMSIKGIGSWTSKMYLLFVLNRPDVLPFEDGAFLQAFRWLYETEDVSRESVKGRCQSWSPFSSIGARYLYRALDMGLVKIPISEFLGNL